VTVSGDLPLSAASPQPTAQQQQCPAVSRRSRSSGPCVQSTGGLHTTVVRRAVDILWRCLGGLSCHNTCCTRPEYQQSGAYCCCAGWPVSNTRSADAVPAVGCLCTCRLAIAAPPHAVPLHPSPALRLTPRASGSAQTLGFCVAAYTDSSSSWDTSDSSADGDTCVENRDQHVTKVLLK
jgi:hypothetical protein